MPHVILILTGIAALAAASMSLSLWGAGLADAAGLPAVTRRRLRWCQGNARSVYLGVGALAVVCVAVNLPLSS